MTIKLVVNDNFHVFQKNENGREWYHNTNIHNYDGDTITLDKRLVSK